MARPTAGARMLDPLPGAPEAKARLAAIVSTMSGERSIPEVCAELGIGEARFHEMRKEFLAEALGLLERKSAGRKPARATPEARRLRELEEEAETLRMELEASRIRTEIALTMPHLLKERLGKDKEGRAAVSVEAGTGIGIGLPERGKRGKKTKRRR